MNRTNIMMGLPVAVTSCVFAQAQADETLPEKDIFAEMGWGIQSDCSEAGMGASCSAPIAEGNGIVSQLDSYTEIDGSPYFYSSLTVFSCEEGEGLQADWSSSTKADRLLNELRSQGDNFDEWKNTMLKLAPGDMIEGSFGAVVLSSAGHLGTFDQEICACKLHYGIEVIQ